MGFETLDDAGVFKISEDTALIQTLDFFTPVVDDPYCFGQIAAANALSDVYAMGGVPLTAMNIVCFPNCEDRAVLAEIIRGGLAKIEEAGAVLVGGHTVDDNEPKYGLSVTGVVHPGRVITNRCAAPGDLIYLTKPLGTGIAVTGIKGEMAGPEVIKAAVETMARLNRDGQEAMQEAGVKAATDVTGFGLLGHLLEMCRASGVNARLWTDRIAFLPGVLELADMGLIPAGTYANRDYLEGRVRIDKTVPGAVADVLYTPETSGGLLICIRPEKAALLEKSLADRGLNLTPIGCMTEKGQGEVEVLRSE